MTDLPAGLQLLLDTHDIRYLSPAQEGRFGLPVGNGDLAAMVWTPPGRLQMTVNKSNTWDDAPELPVSDWHWSPQMEEKTTALVSCVSVTIHNSLPLFEMTYLDDFQARLHLREGLASIEAQSPLYATQVRTTVSHSPDVLIVDYDETASEPVERKITLARWGSRRFFHWYAQIAQDTCIGLQGTAAGCDGECVWIEQQLRRITFVVVARFVGAAVQIYCPNSHTARIVTERTRTLRGQLYLAVVTSEEHPDPLAEARRRVDKAVMLGKSALLSQNARRWAEFWSKSYVRLPDPYLENLYYFSRYQLGASSLGPYPPVHHGGVWLWNHDARQWGHYYHWNQQQLVWPVHAAGHPELARGYYHWRYKGLENAQETAREIHSVDGAFYTDVSDRDGRNAVDGRWEGHLNYNLTPGSQIAMDFWRHYLYTRDRDFLRQWAYPVMHEAARFYLNVLEQNEDGMYHVPASVGYEGHLQVKDCVADLSIIRVSFAACIEAAEELNRDEDFRRVLQDVLDSLAGFVLMKKDGQPVVATGIARENEPNVSYEVRRPYSKGEPLFYRGFWLPMAPAFPSGAVGLADEGSDLLEAVRNGVRIVGPTAAGGWIPSAIFAARLGLADEALDWLAWYVNFCQTLPQGLMQEGVKDDGSTDIWTTCEPWVVQNGKRTEEKAELLRRHFDTPSPEANCNVMTAIQEMLFQSYDGVLRVFPALPDEWSDAAFRLHGVGGFAVTAERLAGETYCVQVESTWGRRCRIANPWPGSEIGVHAEEVSDEQHAVLTGDVLEFDTEAGATYLLSPVDRAVTSISGIHLPIPESGPREGYGRRLGMPRYF